MLEFLKKLAKPFAFLETISGTHWIGGIAVLVTLAGAPSTLDYLWHRFWASTSITPPPQPPAPDPRQELARMGLLWGPQGFATSVTQNDRRAVSLYLDGGWKLEKWIFNIFLQKNFNAETAMHFKDDSINPEDACSVPEIMGVPPNSVWLYVHNYNDNLSADYWYFHSPNFYEDIEKLNDTDRNSLVKRFCGKDKIVQKIDKLADLIKIKPNLTSAESSEIGRWRKVREFLSGTRPAW